MLEVEISNIAANPPAFFADELRTAVFVPFLSYQNDHTRAVKLQTPAANLAMRDRSASISC